MSSILGAKSGLKKGTFWTCEGEPQRAKKNPIRLHIIQELKKKLIQKFYHMRRRICVHYGHTTDDIHTIC